MTVAVTGSDGLFGWHLRCFLKTLPHVDTILIDRLTFAQPSKLLAALGKADTVIHLAGMNRGEDALLYETNISLTQKLIDTLKNLSRTPHVLFANSIHKDRDTAYGRSKNESAKLLWDWAESVGARFSDIVFPHLFGEHGKPFYNSVVSTFCHQIAAGENPYVHQDSEIEPIHLSDASALLWKLIQDKHSGKYRAAGHKITVSELLETIAEMDALYKNRILPKVSTPFKEQLFNTYRSYLYPSRQPIQMELKSDARGSLFEAVKTHEHGQCFLSTTRPGFTRGNHFHIKKLERFCVVKGEATIRIRRLFSEDVVNFNVSGENPCAIDIPTLHTHNITNTGRDELITLFWSGEIFDPQNPDTFAEQVELITPRAQPRQVLTLG